MSTIPPAFVFSVCNTTDNIGIQHMVVYKNLSTAQAKTKEYCLDIAEELFVEDEDTLADIKEGFNNSTFEGLSRMSFYTDQLYVLSMSDFNDN